MSVEQAEVELDLANLVEACRVAHEKMLDKPTSENRKVYKEAAAAVDAARTSWRENYRDPEAGVGGAVAQPEVVTVASTSGLEMEGE